jgi:hypothetical protein
MYKTMKKIYIKPQMETEEIEQMNIVCVSPNVYEEQGGSSQFAPVLDDWEEVLTDFK